MSIPFTATFADPFRPIHEFKAAGVWASSSALSCYALLHQPLLPYAAVAGVALVMAIRRVLQGWPQFVIQRNLRGVAVEFHDREALLQKARAKPEAVYLGVGFDWGQEQAQMVHTLNRNDPDALTALTDTAMGCGWIHGIGTHRERDLYAPLEHLGGHTAVVGTTGSGKTRILDNIITQAVARGDTVLVFDPKGDATLRELTREACVAAGDPSRFYYFHPGFPHQSVAIDMMANFSRATELASRVAGLLPAQDNFSQFGMAAMTNIIEGLLLVHERPSLLLMKRYLTGGPAKLLERACRAHAIRAMGAEEAAESIRPYVTKIDPAKLSDKRRAEALVEHYRDRLQERHGHSGLEGLIGQFEHEASHFSKMIAALIPTLTMLTAGTLGPLLSPDPQDFSDAKPITDTNTIIAQRKVVYIGLDTLSDQMVGAALGSLILSDVTATAGDRYNYDGGRARVTVIVDEAAELANDKLIQLLNKARGAGFQITVALQTLSDLSARLGSMDKARMFLGNVNNLVALRTLDDMTQKFLSESLLKTYVRHVKHGHSTKNESGEPLSFSGTTSESLEEKEDYRVAPALFGCLPNLEFFARVSGGRLLKGRMKILGAPQPAQAA